MDSSSSNRLKFFFPTELVHLVLSSLEEDDSRQPTLHACCLVSNQWYSEAISLLYEKPHLDGARFQQFAATVCPPIGTREPKVRLATLVRQLDMGRLVHQSSNSLTARLLGKVKGNLEVFVVPMYSFS